MSNGILSNDLFQNQRQMFEKYRISSNMAWLNALQEHEMTGQNAVRHSGIRRQSTAAK
jgi:hypothetical protein